MKLIAGKNIHLERWGEQTRISAQLPPPPVITGGRHLAVERTVPGYRISCLENCTAASARSEIRITPDVPVYSNWPVRLTAPPETVADAAAAARWNQNEPEMLAAPLSGQERTGLFAVALETISAGMTGRALLHGTIMLPVKVTNRLHEFVEAVGSGYETVGAGYHRLIWRSVESGAGYGVVLLHSGITPARYFGAFCVEVTTDGKIRIFNSAQPDSAVAGSFYWGINQSAVSVSVQNLTRENGIVYLRATGNAQTRTVTIDFMVKLESVRVLDDIACSHIPLAQVTGNSVEQLYRSGDVRMYWRI